MSADFKPMKFAAPTLDFEANWERLAAAIKVHMPDVSPAELFNMRMMYLQGVHDFLLLNREVSREHPIVAAVKLNAYVKQVYDCVTPEAIAKASEASCEAQRQFELEYISEQMEKRLKDAGITPEDLPHLPSKPTLH